MDLQPVETDYLVIGAGAVAMAFVDTLLSETNARVVMVDQNHRPGGHWNHAYTFVGLHQPSAFYGVNSRALGGWTKDQTGLNQGFYGLASGAEVLSYFDLVMREQFLPSGRVQWFPMTEYSPGADGTHHFRSLLSGEVREVIPQKGVVNATHARTEVPSTHAPKYSVAPGVKCVPLNALPTIKRPFAAYTVVGAGKTAMDACIWLLQNGVAPARIRWIRPRDAWMMDRANVQPGAENFERTIGSTIGQFDAIANATSIPDLFELLEESGLLVRIDTSVAPTMYRCAIVAQAELEQLRRVKDVVRLGRLRSVEPSRIVLDQGVVPADPDTLYVDCSASAIQRPPAISIFDGERINLLMVRACQPVFSAALIAYVESHVSDPAEKNALCTPVPSPDKPTDWLQMWAATIANTVRWRAHPGLYAWLSQCRLNNVNASLQGVRSDDAAKFDLLKEAATKSGIAAAKLPALISAIG